MSPLQSSLAFDEVQDNALEQQATEIIEPQWNVIVNTRQGTQMNSYASFAEDAVKIGGRIVISF